MYVETSDKVKLFVKRAGQGNPCIYIHGGPGAWSYNFEALGGNSLENIMEMVYFDQRGCGRSEGGSDSDYSIDRLVEDIEEIRRQTGIKKWTVLAHSFGGIIAVNYVLKYKEHVDKLILLNCTLFMEDSLINQVKYAAKLLGNEESDANSFDKGKWEKYIGELLEKNLFYNLQYSSYDNYIKVNEVDSKIGNRSLAIQAFNNKGYFKDYRGLTKEIDVPVLVICGDCDNAIGVKHQESFKFPNSKTAILQGRHVLYLENNKEFYLTIKRFIEEHSS